MVDPESRACCAIRGVRSGPLPLERTVLGQRPSDSGRAGELAEARALAEMAFGALLAEWREQSATKHISDG